VRLSELEYLCFCITEKEERLDGREKVPRREHLGRGQSPLKRRHLRLGPGSRCVGLWTANARQAYRGAKKRHRVAGAEMFSEEGGANEQQQKGAKSLALAYRHTTSKKAGREIAGKDPRCLDKKKRPTSQSNAERRETKKEAYAAMIHKTKK